jgi:hypothetical protein
MGVSLLYKNIYRYRHDSEFVIVDSSVKITVKGTNSQQATSSDSNAYIWEVSSLNLGHNPDCPESFHSLLSPSR